MQTEGLRERKKAQTRTSIVKAAFELVLERGYDGATIARIAERADVAPRTIHTIFSGKEEILLGHLGEDLARFERALSDGDGDTIDRIDRWIEQQIEGRSDGDAELESLQLRAFVTDTSLRSLEHESSQQLESLIAASAAVDLGVAADSLTAHAFAASAVAVFLGMRQRIVEQGSAPMDEFREALRFLRGALDASTKR